MEIGLRLIPDKNPPLAQRSVRDQMHDRSNLSKSLGKKVGFEASTPTVQIEPGAFKADLATQLLLEALDDLTKATGSRAAQRGCAQGNRRIEIGLVEGELALAVCGHKAFVHRKHLSRRQ